MDALIAVDLLGRPQIGDKTMQRTGPDSDVGEPGAGQEVFRIAKRAFAMLSGIRKNCEGIGIGMRDG